MAKRKLPEASSAVNHRDFVPSGSTLLNLALTGHPFAGWSLGKSGNLVGDSNAGKTFLALCAQAEACQLPRFDDYKCVYDGTEFGADGFDIGEVFGASLAERLEFPNDGGPSDTIEDVEHNLVRYASEGPVLYILDSFDGVSSRDEEKKAKSELKKATKEGEEDKPAKGSYGLAKTKRLGQLFRRANKHLEATRSHFLVVSQVRENIDPKSFVKKYRTGGKALDFFPSQVAWLAITGSVTRREDWKVGVQTRCSVTKTRSTGLRPRIDFEINYKNGLDDVGSIIDWMLKEEVWEKRKNTIVAPPPIDKEGLKETLIKYIEAEDLEKPLMAEAGKAWKRIQESLLPERKKKYQ